MKKLPAPNTIAIQNFNLAIQISTYYPGNVRQTQLSHQSVPNGEQKSGKLIIQGYITLHISFGKKFFPWENVMSFRSEHSLHVAH